MSRDQEGAALFDLVHQVEMERARGRPNPLPRLLSTVPGTGDAVVDLMLEGFLARRLRESSPSPESAEPGLIGGHYRPLRELGRGGQGRVVLAEDLRLDRQVAIKLLDEAKALSAPSRERLEREARLLSRVDHPGICPVYETGTEDGVPFVVMRHIEGRTLSSSIQDARRLGERWPRVRPDRPSTRDDILRLFEALAAALQAAHAAGVVHRDVKPANVLIETSGTPVLVDFGVARIHDDAGSTVTRTGDVFGTPAYMSPEHFRGDGRRLGPESDVFSLGVVLFEALTLERPFSGATPSALETAIIARPHPDPRRLDRGLSRDLAVVLATALAKEPRHRYRSAADFGEDLRRAREGKAIRARPAPLLRRALLLVRRRPAASSLVLVVALALPSIGGLLLRRELDRPRVEAARRREALDRYEKLVLAGFAGMTGDGVRPTAVPNFEAALAVDIGRERREAVFGLVLAHVGAGRAERAREVLARHGAGFGDRRAGARLRELTGAAVDGTAPLPDPEAVPFRDPTDHLVESWYLLESVRRGRTDRTEAAVAHALRACLDSPTRNVLALRNLVLAAGQGRSLPLLAVATRALLAGDEHDVTFLLVASAAHGMAADYETCARYARDAVAEDPASAEAWTNLGGALLRLGRKDEAEPALRRATEIAPDFAIGWQNLASFLGAAARNEEAFDAASKAIAAAPSSGVGLPEAVRALEGLGRIDDALVLVDAPLQRDLPASEWQHERGRMLQKAGRYVDAAEALARAVRADPGAPKHHCNLGFVLQSAGDLEGAVAAFRRGHELGASRADWKFPSADWLARAEKGLARVRSFEASMTADPEPRGSTLEERAFEAHAIGRWPIAARLFDRVLLEKGESLPLERNLRSKAAEANQYAGLGFGPAAPLSPDLRRAHRARALALLEAEWSLSLRALEAGTLDAERFASLWRPRVEGRSSVLLRSPLGFRELDATEGRAWVDLRERILKRLAGIDADAGK